jgi:hypothetical protein
VARLRAWLAVVALAALGSVWADDKGPEMTAHDFVRAFLREQPRFRITGTLVTRKVNQPVVECGAKLRFDRELGAAFAYNTTGAGDWPYDFYYWNRTLHLFVYDTDRTTLIKAETLGAPYRTAFNFVWEVLREAEEGAGLTTLIFNGLMHLEVKPRPGGAEVLFTRRFGPLAVKRISFVFDDAYRLRSMALEETDGDTYHFKAQTFEKLTRKLPKPKLRKNLPPSW